MMNHCNGLREIFDKTGDESTFYGFEKDLTDTFGESDDESTFLGFKTGLYEIFDETDINSTFFGFEPNLSNTVFSTDSDLDKSYGPINDVSKTIEELFLSDHDSDFFGFWL